MTLGPSDGGALFPIAISERAAKQVSLTAAELMKSISSVLNDLISLMIERRTAEDFRSLRQNLFPKYFAAIQASSNLARIIIPRPTMERVTAESFCELEADFREHGLIAFGAEVRDQSLFTIWTLRKIWSICEQIADGSLRPELKDQDAEFRAQFGSDLVWARFHLDCLIFSMRTNKPIYPGVLEVLIEGLRAAVNAYTWARRGLDLRIAPQESERSLAEWDDEDQQLLREATYDLIQDE